VSCVSFEFENVHHFEFISNKLRERKETSWRHDANEAAAILQN
jgi:hypothetical protein